ncbi:hypothetical protein D3C84_1115670 [compost metagenome]
MIGAAMMVMNKINKVIAPLVKLLALRNDEHPLCPSFCTPDAKEGIDVAIYTIYVPVDSSSIYKAPGIKITRQ